MKNLTFTERNVTMTTVDVYISPVIKIVSFLTCLWIVLAHSFIVVCFIVNRSKPWTNYSKQILSLSLNDLLIGVACIFLLVEFSIGVGIHFVLCSVSFYFFFAALCASVYHVLAICVYRALTLTRQPAHAKPTSVKLSASLVLLAWIMSFCLCACPFIFWSQNNESLPRCQIDFLFEHQWQVAIGFFAVCYIFPILLTNIVYAITCCKLLFIWRKIFPTAVTEATQSSTQNTFTMETVSHSNRSGAQAQRKASGTIGLLLFFLNLFTIPLLYVMIAEYSGISSSRNVRTVSSNVFILNSVVSPFVYAIRTKFLRTALKDLLKNCVPCIFICK